MDNALTLIQEKISEVEAKLAHLRIAEAELTKLTKAAQGFRIAAPTKKSQVTVKGKAVTEGEETRAKSLTSLIRETLAASEGLTVAQLRETLISGPHPGINNRAVSFTLQALKRKGEARNQDNVWSIVKRRGRKARAA